MDSDAGIETCSVFEKDDHVFGYLELKNPEVIRDVMAESDVQVDWDKTMAGIIEEDKDI